MNKIINFILWVIIPIAIIILFYECVNEICNSFPVEEMYNSQDSNLANTDSIEDTYVIVTYDSTNKSTIVYDL